jgi:glutamine amidotransferase
VCRLFGLTAGTERVSATFWLLDAPDSLQVQSHRNADGSGIGFFDPAGQPVLDKRPEPAYRDQQFTREARQASAATFVAHVRWASTGGRSVQNTHPFAMHGQIMAHNGGFGGLARIEEQLGPYRELVLGDTDSERYFALIIQQIDTHGGDVAAGFTAAARWIGQRLPVSSLNAILTAPGELWALRYPAQHALHVIERPAGDSLPAATATGQAVAAEPTGPVAQSSGPGRPAGHVPPRNLGQAAEPADSAPGLHVRSATSSIHVPALRQVPTVVVASERLDGETGWRMLASGELIHVRPDLTVESAVVIPEPPAQLVPVPPSANIDT